jgi:hypothetical protein
MPGRSGRHAKWFHSLLQSGNYNSRRNLSPTETTALKSNFLNLKARSALERQPRNHIPPCYLQIQHPKQTLPHLQLNRH